MAGLTGGSSTGITKYSGIDLPTSALGVCIAIVWGENRISHNVIWLGDFTATSAGKGGKGGMLKGGGQYDYTTAAILALCEGPINKVNVMWSGGQGSFEPFTQNLTIFDGTASQAPPSWMESNFPSQALAYAYTAYAFSDLLQLNQSPFIPDYTYEVRGIFYGSVAGFNDVNPADVINDFLTNAQYGVGLAGTYIDPASLAFYKTYCTAQSLFFSPALTDQEQAMTTLQRWAQLTNTWIFWSGGVLKFVPLGDSEIVANGTTYIPNLTIVYSFNYDDFQITDEDPDSSPLIIQRIDPADGYNRVQIDVSDRTNQYNSTPVYWEDLTNETEYGELQAVIVSAPEVCSLNIAAVMAALIGQRAVWLRNNYSFKLPYWAVLLEPGDIVSLTDPLIGITNFLVRITSVTEESDQVLTVTAEEFPQGIGTAYPIAVQVSGGAMSFNSAAIPPPVN